MTARAEKPAAKLRAIFRKLSADLRELEFAPPVTHVYDPLAYASRPHDRYLARYGHGAKEVVFLGMNPGPWGMAQTGVPFGEVAHVRDWLGIEAKVEAPPVEHPARPVQGFACPRSEVSGARLWGWARERFGEPDAFFERFFVANYCPLAFLEESGRNRTPDKLPLAERKRLFAACDRALRALVLELRPRMVLGVGRFAEDRARSALADLDVTIASVLHPSPASPLANRGWASQMDARLAELGVELP